MESVSDTSFSNLISEVLNDENIDITNTLEYNTTNISVSENINQNNINIIVSDAFLELLGNLKGEIFYKLLLEHGFDCESLKYITPAHLSEICPKILYGPRVIFEYNLRAWQEQLGIVTTHTTSSPSLSPTLSCSSSFENFFDEADDKVLPKNIVDELNKTVKGKHVIEFYKKGNFLNEKYRRMLGEVIIETIIDKKIQANPKFFKKISEEIVKIFPTEVEETYYLKIPKRRPAGILYAKYHNVLSKLKIEGLAGNQSKPMNQPSTSSSCCKQLEEAYEIPDASNETDRTWLKYNIEPLETVMEKWKTTTKYRLTSLEKHKTITETLEEWPIYKQSFGYQLIERDFMHMFPEKENKLYQNWKNFSTRVLPLMKTKIKDDYSKLLLEKYNNEENCSDTNNLIILMLLSSLIVPTSRISTGNAKSRKLKKTSISDSRNSFILHVNVLSDLYVKIKNLIDFSFENSTTVQPIICIVGQDILNITEFYVYYFNTYYKLQNIMKCIDICFKIFHVFNLKYPAECKLVWSLIQKDIYEIHTQYDEKNSTLLTLLADLKK